LYCTEKRRKFRGANRSDRSHTCCWLYQKQTSVLFTVSITCILRVSVPFSTPICTLSILSFPLLSSHRQTERTRLARLDHARRQQRRQQQGPQARATTTTTWPPLVVLLLARRVARRLLHIDAVLLVLVLLLELVLVALALQAVVVLTDPCLHGSGAGHVPSTLGLPELSCSVDRSIECLRGKEERRGEKRRS
jgi:hypothetical protein